MSKNIRPSWDETFLDMATVLAKRTTCPRAIEAYGGVGAIIVGDDNRILGAGYAGSLPGRKHCTEVGCLIIPPDTGCRATIHGEQNALLHMRDAPGKKTLYVTASPCLACLHQAIVKGVTRVVFRKLYRLSTEQVRVCNENDVRWVHLPYPEDVGVAVPKPKRGRPKGSKTKKGSGA